MKQYCINCVYESLPHTIRQLEAGRVLFREGDPLTHVWRIRNGLVKITKLHVSGDEKVFDILGEGDYLALIALLQGQPHYIATAETLTPTTLVQIERDAVNGAYESNPLFQKTCLQCAVTRTNMFQRQLFHISNVDTEEKILSVLQLLAKRFGIEHDGRIVLELPFNKTILAGIVGIRRETLSRNLSAMQDKRILRVEKNTYIFDRV